jgi:hypothetical protein
MSTAAIWDYLDKISSRYIGGTIEITKYGENYQATIASIVSTKNTIRFTVLGKLVLSKDKGWVICHNRPVFIHKTLHLHQRELDVLAISNHDPKHPLQYFLYPKESQEEPES